MKLIVGLGNPDSKYTNTRHNLGQNIVTSFCKNNRLDLDNSSKMSAQIAKYQNGLLTVTSTYMNTSGEAVQKLINFYKISPTDLYIIHDDLDLGVGEYRLQFDRSSAGHNGIKSIVDGIGTQAFNRIRVGIGHPRNSTNPNLPVEDYVLLPFAPKEKVIIKETIDKIVGEVLPSILGH